MKKLCVISLTLSALLLLAGCAKDTVQPSPVTTENEPPAITEAQPETVSAEPSEEQAASSTMETTESTQGNLAVANASTLDDIKTTPPEEFVMPDEIPDNLELRVDDNGNFYYLELYPEEFSSLQEYEEYLLEQERQAEEKDRLNTNNTTDATSGQSSQENSNQNIEDEDMGITDDTNTPTSQRRFGTLEDIGPAGKDAGDPNEDHTPDVDYSGLHAVC